MLDARKRDRVEEILKDPALFPDEFKTWIVKAVETHPTFTLPQAQLPVLDREHAIGGVAEPAFQNSWVNYDPANSQASFYRDLSRRVYVGGTVKSGGAGTVIFTLPPAYRPSLIETFFVGSIVLEVQPDGDVRHVSGSTALVPLTISFRV